MSAPRAAPSALAVASDREKSAVLDELVAADHALEDRAERVVRSRLAQVQTDEVANAVVAAVLALDQDDLAAHAGRTRYGYVEPTEAAWSLLEAAVEPWLEDITRRARLGLTDAARRIGLGILGALQQIGLHARNDDLLVSWAPDFAAETAGRVVEILVDAGIDPTAADIADAADGLL